MKTREQIMMTAAISTKIIQIIEESVTIGQTINVAITPQIVAASIRTALMHVEVHMLKDPHAGKVLREGLIDLLESSATDLISRAGDVSLRDVLGPGYDDLGGDPTVPPPTPEEAPKKVVH